MIPYGRQNISEQDIQAVVEVLQSDYITQGPKVPAFELAIADYCQASYAVASNSATSALHLACLALDVGPRDIVWTSPISFVASANCALYCGASVDFVDVDPVNANICLEALERKLRQAKTENRLPKVLVVVHFAGLSCDMQSIAALATKYHFSIIEDASHAIGASYQQQPVGNCLYSDITVFSFHPVKIITTAEGGMATTNDQLLAEKMAQYRSHGITRDPKRLQQHADQPWYYEQQLLGFNYRLTELQAALGLSQVSRIDSFIAKRRELAARYQKALSGLPLRWQQEPQDVTSSYHLFVVQLTEQAKISREQVFKRCQQAGIGVNVHYIPIYQQPYYQQFAITPTDFPNAEHYYRHCLSLPLFPDLGDADFNHIVATLTDMLSEQP